MTPLILEKLIEEVSADLPCGDNLEYDADFLAMERASKGKPEQAVGEKIIEAEEPDWSEVHARALKLLDRTRDIRVASHLTRALLHSEGIAGFARGLALLRAYLERHWANVHPQLDPEDGQDPTARVNAILALTDPETTLGALRRAPLVSSTLGRFGLRHLQLARGQIVPGAGETAPDPKSIDAAFAASATDDLKATHQSVADSLDSVAALEAFFIATIGANNAPDLSALSDTLKSMRGVLEEQLGRRGIVDGSAAHAPVPNGSGGVDLSGGIRTREDAARALDAIINYFARHEPSSPVPLLLRRAKRLISKSFLEIVRDLAPEGIKQAESFRGADGEE